MVKRDLNELDELEKELNQYLVKYPDEQKINITIDALRQYVPQKQKNTVRLKERLFLLVKRSTTEITLISKTYWSVSAILFLLGYLMTNSIAYDPLVTLIIIAPIPFVIGLVEVFKGRERGLLEMEMACKFSVHEIMLSRLFLIVIYNLTLNTILTISFASLFDTVSMMQIILAWLTPLTLFAAISLWLSMKFRGPVFITLIGSIWLIMGVLFISRPVWLDVLINMNFIFHLLFMGVGIFLFSLQIRYLIKRYSSYEGVEVIEVNY